MSFNFINFKLPSLIIKIKLFNFLTLQLFNY